MTTTSLLLKQYKAIISDLDGTLIGKEFIASDNLIHAVKKWREAGNRFSLATGVAFHRLEKFARQLELSDPIATSGGAIILDPLTQKVLYAEYIGEKTARRLVQFLLDNKINCITSQGKYMYKPDYTPDKYKNEKVIFKNITEIDYSKIAKLSIYGYFYPDEVIKPLIQSNIIEAFSDLTIYQNFTPRSGLLWDVTSQNVSKHIATLKLIELFNLDPGEVIGIGDGMNDYPLLTACGYKVAMENAPEELKEIADMIIPSYHEDGVVTLINNLLLSC